jgi:hypothetical protein
MTQQAAISPQQGEPYPNPKCVSRSRTQWQPHTNHNKPLPAGVPLTAPAYPAISGPTGAGTPAIVACPLGLPTASLAPATAPTAPATCSPTCPGATAAAPPAPAAALLLLPLPATPTTAEGALLAAALPAAVCALLPCAVCGLLWWPLALNALKKPEGSLEGPSSSEPSPAAAASSSESSSYGARSWPRALPGRLPPAAAAAAGSCASFWTSFWKKATLPRGLRKKLQE